MTDLATGLQQSWLDHLAVNQITGSAWFFRVKLEGHVVDHEAELYGQVHEAESVSLVVSHQSFDVVRLDVRARDGDSTLPEASLEVVVVQVR